MEKKNLVAISIAIPSGILFALGMVLVLVSEWNMYLAGIVMGAIGLIGLLAIIPIYHKLGHYKVLKSNPMLILSLAIGILGLFILGVGMCLIMTVSNPATWQIVLGLVIGIIGLLLVSFNPVIYRVLEGRKLNNDNNQNQVSCEKQ